MNPIKKSEFAKVKPNVNTKIQPITHFHTKSKNKLIFTELYLEQDTIVFIDSIFDMAEENLIFPGGE